VIQLIKMFVRYSTCCARLVAHFLHKLLAMHLLLVKISSELFLNPLKTFMLV